MNATVVAPEDLAAVPSEYLEAELVAHAAWEATGMARMLDVLAEFDRRRVWDSWGCASPQQWLGWKCALGYTAASERLRVARALTDLPVIRESFSRGKLSYSKVRELTRIATPATDETLAVIAESATAAQVAKMARALRKRTAKDAANQVESRGMRWETDDTDGSVVITLRLPTDAAQAVIAAVNAATSVEAGVPTRQSRADACARLITGDDEVRARPEVIVHLHADAAASGSCPATPRRQCPGRRCAPHSHSGLRVPGHPSAPSRNPPAALPFHRTSGTVTATGRAASRANVVRACESRVSTARTRR